MKKRLLFIIVYIVLFPLFIVAFCMAFIGMPIGIIVWLITGDENKALSCVFGGVQGWLIELPYKLFDRY